MLIAIPSRARAGQANHTFERLPPALQKDAVLVVSKQEALDYIARFGKNNVVRTSHDGIGRVRQHVLRFGDVAQKIVMLDDDLTFYERRKDDPTKLLNASPASITKLFKAIDKALDSYAHVGVAAREGANRCADPVILNTRMLRVLAYRTDILKAEGIRYDRLPVMEDFDVTLQLLRKGYANAVINGWAQDQGTSNAPGGCSTYRTREVQAAGAHGLKKLHPDFVTVVTKETKGAWGGGERTDVRIAWKKAYEEGLRNAR